MDVCNMGLDGRDRIVIFGCGGQARSIVNVLYESGRSMEILLVDENACNNEMIMGCKVQRTYDLMESDGYIIAFGDNFKRKEVYNSLLSCHKGCCISVISVHALIGTEARIGKGTFVAPGAYIGPQAEIGNNSIINTGSVIEHEAFIGSHTHIAPNVTICGRTKIGNNVFCGAGSVIIDKINVCGDVMIGAGAVVKEDITEPGTYVGIPARKIK